MPKPLTEFNRSGGTKDGLHTYCRACQSEHYKSRKDVHVANVYRTKRLRAETVQAYVLQYLLAHPCIDCGEGDPVVLEFDHRGDKVASVSQMISDGLPFARIVAEMDKCDIRCANCHRRRTYSKLGHRSKGAFVAKQDKAPDF